MVSNAAGNTSEVLRGREWDKGNKVKEEERSRWLEGSGLGVTALSLKDSLQTAIFVFFVLKKRTLGPKSYGMGTSKVPKAVPKMKKPTDMRR
ncbi:hypothetical protein MC885_003130 [Smutsia gigantea]|nr:hypothetical protein MC885_003130 [Smutsia gigantea]